MSRVGHDNHDEVEKKLIGPADTFLAGAMTGTLSRVVVQPFDVLKIRLQLQAEARSEARYRSVHHAVSRILKEEGARAFWKGHVSGQWLSVVYGSIHFGLYQTFWYRAVSADPSVAHSRAKVAGTDMVLGVATGFPATVISYPFDVVRTRMVGQFSSPSCKLPPEGQLYRGVADAFVKIHRHEGPRGFFKGLGAALYTLPLANGLNLCIYNYIKPFYAPHVTNMDRLNIPYLSQLATLFFGGLTGTITKTLTFPLDTVKKRLQVQGFESGRAAMGRTPKYAGFFHCLVTVARDEGIVRGLFKGWVPGIAKAFPSGAIQFYLLESSMYLIARFRKAAVGSD